jgi:hypothetical protein
MRIALLSVLVTFTVVACTFHADITWVDSPIGSGSASIDVTIDSKNSTTPPKKKKVVATGVPNVKIPGCSEFQVIDANGNGKPDAGDLLYCPKTKKAYPITKMNVLKNATKTTLPLISATVDNRPMYYARPALTFVTNGDTYHKNYGFDAIKSNGTANFKNTLIHAATPIRGLDDTGIYMSYCWSTRFRAPDARSVTCRSEFFYLPAANDQWFYVHRIQGTLRECCQWMAKVGMRDFLNPIGKDFWIRGSDAQNKGTVAIRLGIGADPKTAQWIDLGSVSYR